MAKGRRIGKDLWSGGLKLTDNFQSEMCLQMHFLRGLPLTALKSQGCVVQQSSKRKGQNPASLWELLVTACAWILLWFAMELERR